MSSETVTEEQTHAEKAVNSDHVQLIVSSATIAIQGRWLWYAPNGELRVEINVDNNCDKYRVICPPVAECADHIYCILCISFVMFTSRANKKKLWGRVEKLYLLKKKRST